MNYLKDSYNKTPSVKELPLSERPREKMLSRGVSYLSNAELIAVLLGKGGKNISVMDLSSKVLSLENNLKNLASYQPEEFMSIPGIGVAKACTLAAALELGRRMATTTQKNALISTADDAATLFMEELRYSNKESFKVALLNIKNQLIMKDDISIGGLNSAAAHPREVFQNAVKKGAASIILFHNHPSGDPTPSADDISVTKQLVESGKILGIKVIDHIVIGDGTYKSFKALGLI